MRKEDQSGNEDDMESERAIEGRERECWDDELEKSKRSEKEWDAMI